MGRNPLTRDQIGNAIRSDEEMRQQRVIPPDRAATPIVITSQQWAVKGAISTTLEIPPIFVTSMDSADGDYSFQTDGVDGEPLGAGAHPQAEEVYLIGVKHYLGVGTSATLQIRTAPAGGGSQRGLNFTPSAGFGGAGQRDWDGVRVYDGDHLHLRCTAIVGSPRILTVAAVFAHLYGPAS